jgi:hypothetical protein
MVSVDTFALVSAMLTQQHNRTNAIAQFVDARERSQRDLARVGRKAKAQTGEDRFEVDFVSVG